MKAKSKVNFSGNKKLYAGTFVFSLFWLCFAVIFSVTRRIDYSWDHFVVNLPAMLSFFDYSVTEGMPNSYSFGKYITKPANPKITITAIDELTVERYGYPFKRRYYGEVVDKLVKLGTKAIVFDVILAKSNRDDTADDNKYVEAVARAGNVVNLIFIDADTTKVKPPIAGLTKASAIIAQPHVETTQDSDGQIRRYLPFYAPKQLLADEYKWLTYSAAGLKDVKCGEECAAVPVPSIGMAAYALYSGKTLSQLFFEYDNDRILNYRDVSVRKLNPGWDKNPNNLKVSSFRHISFADILSGQLSKEEKEALKGGVTFVGSTAIGAFDHVPSPFSAQFPGVEVHATFLDNLLAGDFRNPLSPPYTTFLVLFLPWLPVILRRYSLAVLISACSAVMGAMVVLDVVLLAHNVLMPFGSVFLSLFLPFAYVTVDKGLAEGREKKWIKNTFGQYLSPKVVDLITKDPSKLSLGGEKRDMTAFFLDLAGFTTMSEKLSPEELTAMLVEYLSAFTDVILKYDGTVDKYIGDCIVAFWNAPLDQADHRKLGVLAAIDCQKEMTRLNESLTQFTIKPKCRVGVNSGPMVVGNMGSRTRLSYTVMGDSVNMASRMEGANKFFASKIMTSEATFGDLKEFFDHRYLGSIRVVGKLIPVKVYEPFALKGEATADVQAMLKHYEAGMEKFYAGDYAGSLPAFKAALAARPGDGPSQYYIDTAEQYIKEPPKDWDQSFNLTSKG
ncbi:MAG: adenylate/guanylate cyclase domain-containing protein [Elusimicrobia bacterium]|nr:adenylate/guanylate cyclase domain-containing protein [Elusimicrobiota bacterium]